MAAALIGAVSAGAQSHWDPEAMMVGAVIGGVSGGVGAVAYGAVGGGIVGSTFGGMAGGATAGGMFSTYYGGNVLEGMVKGAVIGGFGGAAFGGIGEYYGNDRGFGRTVAQGIAGGALTEMGGGRFEDGFIFSGSAALAMWGWQYSKSYTDQSSLQQIPPPGRDSTGELMTAGTRHCVGCSEANQNWFTRAGMSMEGSEYK